MKLSINDPKAYPEYRISGGKKYRRGDTTHVLKQSAQFEANYMRRWGYRAIVVPVKKPKPEWKRTGRWIVYLRKP